MSPQIIAFAITGAALPFVDSTNGKGPLKAANELGNNVATMLIFDNELTVREAAESAIRHRMKHNWIKCGDVEMTVAAIERAVSGLRKAAA